MNWWLALAVLFALISMANMRVGSAWYLWYGLASAVCFGLAFP